MIEITNKDLKSVVDKLIAEMKLICENKTGRMKFSEIIALFPDFPDELKPEIINRGYIYFDITGFRNPGPKKTLEYDVNYQGMKLKMKIELPMVVKGEYYCTEDGFILSFNKGDTIGVSVKKSFLGLSTELKGIKVSSDQIFIDMENNMVDVLIHLA